MTEDELDAIRRAVLQDPYDDAPRLIYADALDEAGRADEAKFIREQIRFQHPEVFRGPESNMTTIALTGRIDKLADMPAHLLVQRVRLTTPASICLCNRGMSMVVVRRGFIHSVITGTDTWRRVRTRMMRRHPIVRAVVGGRLRDWMTNKDRWRAAAGLPPL